MSIECPNGHGRQCVIGNINVEGKPIRRGDDVQIMKLACGCQVGGPRYKVFLARISAIRKTEGEQLIALKECTRLSIGAEYQKYQEEEA